MNLDFTATVYQKILEEFNKNDYKIYCVTKLLSNKRSGKTLFLRHDVDRKPKNALAMAKLEKKMGIYSTYYFRIKPCSFNKDIIKEIAQMGHEIGYHYENLADAKGNYNKAISDFEKNLNGLRKIANIKTIAMHGSPLSKYDNRDLWKKYSYKKYGIVLEPYFDIDYKKMYYLTDTGRCWNSENNRRDVVSGLHIPRKIIASQDFIQYIPNIKKNVLLSVHPERWAINPLDYIYQYIFDMLSNSIKTLIRASSYFSTS